MKTSHYRSEKRMPRAAFETQFDGGAFVYINCYLQYLTALNSNLKMDVTELRAVLEKADDGKLDRTDVWRFIDIISSAIELFDDFAVFVTHSSGQIKKLHENIAADKQSPQKFYRLGEASAVKLTKNERKRLLSKAFGIYGYSKSTWYRKLSAEDRSFIKAIFQRQVIQAEIMCSALDKVQKAFRIVHTKAKHAPGCIFIPDTVVSPKISNSWSIIVMSSLAGGKQKRKGIPLSADMLEVICSAVDTTVSMLVTVCEQNLIRIRTFDKYYLPYSVANLTDKEQARYAKLLNTLPKTDLHDITLTIKANMTLKKKSFYSNPKDLWNSYTKGVGSI